MYQTYTNQFKLNHVNSSPPEQYGRHFANYIFRCIFVNETFCILTKISPKFVPNAPVPLAGDAAVLARRTKKVADMR